MWAELEKSSLGGVEKWWFNIIHVVENVMELKDQAAKPYSATDEVGDTSHIW